MNRRKFAYSLIIAPFIPKVVPAVTRNLPRISLGVLSSTSPIAGAWMHQAQYNAYQEIANLVTIIQKSK